MRRCALCFLVMVCCWLVTPAVRAQDNSSLSTATCNFDEDKQIVLHYQPATSIKKNAWGGKIWAPGSRPITLFTNTRLVIGGNHLPIGAYTMFLLPASGKWTLIVSKSTDTSGTYAEGEDVARVTMDSGELPVKVKELSISMGRVSPNECSIRFDFEKIGYFTSLQQE